MTHVVASIDQAFQFAFDNRDSLPMWVVYAVPGADTLTTTTGGPPPPPPPPKVVSRLWLTLPQERDTGITIGGERAEDLNALFERAGLFRLPPSPGDDPSILATWL